MKSRDSHTTSDFLGDQASSGSGGHHLMLHLHSREWFAVKTSTPLLPFPYPFLAFVIVRHGGLAEPSGSSSDGVDGLRTKRGRDTHLPRMSRGGCENRFLAEGSAPTGRKSGTQDAATFPGSTPQGQHWAECVAHNACGVASQQGVLQSRAPRRADAPISPIRRRGSGRAADR